MHTIRSIDDIPYEPFQAAYAKWMSLRGTKVLPELAPWDMATDALPDYRMVAEVTRQPRRIFYLSVSKKLEDLYGKPVQGKDLDELYNAWFRKVAYQSYELLIEGAAPVYEKRAINTIVKKLGYQKIILPFGKDAVSHAITFLVPLNHDLSDRADWEAMVKETPWL